MKTLSKKSVLNSLVSIFVLLITLLIFSSGCTPPETTANTIINPANPTSQIIYNVNFVTPTFGDIYSTDMDELGDTIDPEPVNIDVEISGNRIFETLGIQIRNNASQLIYFKYYDDIENKLTYNIEETFLTNIADIYEIYVVSTYEGTGSIYSEPMVFEYQIPGGN